jgi:hypothetical protein
MECPLKVAFFEVGIEPELDLFKPVFQGLGVEVIRLSNRRAKWVHKKDQPKLAQQRVEHAIHGKRNSLKERIGSVHS